MMSVDRLLEEAKQARLQRLPQYAQELIFDLARSLEREHRAASDIQERAEKEVTEARALLTSGPEDSDTFASLPSSLYTMEEDEERPLGKGTSIEFRAPDNHLPGNGISVARRDNGDLEIRSMAQVAVIPLSTHNLLIREL